MRKYVVIGCGGFIGAVLRYFIKEMPSVLGSFPINTLIINLCGAFLLGLVLTVALEVWEWPADIRLGLTVGLLGAFTTFSTMCKETVALMKNGQAVMALAYIAGSAILGLAAVYCGVNLARFIGLKVR